MRLHFFIGCHDRRWTSRRRHDFQFSGIHILFADHERRRSRVDNKFSFLHYKLWWRKQPPIFQRWKECCFMFLLNFLGYFWPTSKLLHGHIALAFLSLLETNPQIFETLGLRWWGSRGQIIPSDGFWSRMSAWRITAFVNWTHRIGFRMPELFRKIDEDFGGSTSWNTQPNCRVIFSIATAILSPFVLDFLQGCSSTWPCA